MSKKGKEIMKVLKKAVLEAKKNQPAQKAAKKPESPWLDRVQAAFDQSTPADWLPAQYQYTLKHLREL